MDQVAILRAVAAGSGYVLALVGRNHLSVSTQFGTGSKSAPAKCEEVD